MNYFEFQYQKAKLANFYIHDVALIMCIINVFALMIIRFVRHTWI